MTPKLRTLLWLIAVIVPLDQLTKYWVSTSIAYGSYIQVIDGFFKITHARNPGAALGIAQDAPIWVFIALTLLALGMIASFFRKIAPDDRLSAVALGLIVAGAIGNLIDRVWHQEVIDFLQFDLQLFIFPDFNVADSAIVIGVGLLLLDALTQETEQSAAGPPDPTRDAPS
jgi:signal peptidase II